MVRKLDLRLNNQLPIIKVDVFLRDCSEMCRLVVVSIAPIRGIGDPLEGARNLANKEKHATVAIFRMATYFA